ncbi:MAG: hypothetical protein MHM6MM_000637 [Cercozoa sp. M6MM]
MGGPRRRMSKAEKLSRTLSKILRHKAAELGLEMSADGYTPVEDVLALHDLQRLKATFADVRECVDTNEKKRFGLKQEDGVWYIRAHQGHTMTHVKSHELLTPVTLDTAPNLCVHGTYFKSWPLIRDTGLRSMSRNNVHFAPGDKIKGDGAVISGMRASADIYIYVDIKQAIRDGVPFFISGNDVLLSPGIKGDSDTLSVPPRYFKKVTRRSKRSGEWQVIFRDGAPVSADTDSESGSASATALVSNTPLDAATLDDARAQLKALRKRVQGLERLAARNAAELSRTQKRQVEALPDAKETLRLLQQQLTDLSRSES